MTRLFIKFLLISAVLGFYSCSERAENSKLPDRPTAITEKQPEVITQIKEDSVDTKEQVLATTSDRSISNTNMKNDFVPFERTPLKVGQSIMIYAGDSNYLFNQFHKDTLFGKIIDRVWAKAIYGRVFIELKNAKPPKGVFALSDDYLDSKRGYDESTLSIWDQIPTDEERVQAKYDFFFEIENTNVETGIKFKIIR